MSSGAPVDRFREAKFTTTTEVKYQEEIDDYFQHSVGSNLEKLRNFPKYVPRQHLARFLTRYEMFKQVLEVQGSIVECGVLFGGGLMTFAQLSTILEPINHQRRIIGFDTFSGFPDLHANDTKGVSTDQHKPSGYGVDSYEDLQRAIELYDANRFLSHIPKIDLIRGDARQTIPAYIKENEHTIVSLLYLDFDLYEPTKIALEHFVPRIPKGGIIAFDELNCPSFPGETTAVLEDIGIPNLRLRRFPFTTYLSYAVVE